MNLHRMAAVLLISIQAMLMAEYSGDLWFSALAVSLALLAVWFQLPMPRWLKAMVAIVAAVSFFSKNIVQPPEIDLDWIFPGRFVIASCQTLIALQLIEFLSTAKKERMTLFFGIFSLTAFLIAFCRIESFSNSHLFYGAATSMAVAFSFIWNPQITQTNSDPRTRWFKFGVYGFSIIFIALSTTYLSSSIKSFSEVLRYVISDRVAQTIERNEVKVAYAASGKLDVISSFRDTNPDQVAIAVVSRVAPGYLRGRVFGELDVYGWTEGKREKFQALQPVAASQLGIQLLPGSRLFGIPSPSEIRQIRVEVRNSQNHIGRILFTPVGLTYLEGIGGGAMVDRHHVVRSGISGREPYVAYIPAQPQKIELDPLFGREMLRVPAKLREAVEPISLEICATGDTDAERIKLVEDHFRENYQYSIEPQIFPSANPIAYFINQRPAAHCEFFATAAATVLRLNGIPARYVTGFTVTEISSDDDTELGSVWVARNRNAHAWVEAFDRQQQRWVIVEATSNTVAPKDIWQEEQSTGETAIRQSNLFEVPVWTRSFLDWISMMTQSYLQTIINVALVIFVIASFVWFFARKRSGHWSANYGLKDRARMMRKLDQRLRQINLVRDPSETLHQFAARLQNYSGDEDWVTAAAEQYLVYAQARYDISSLTR